ncbi:MAG: tetratricopeptide repeat protein [Anaerolineales bacterium]
MATIALREYYRKIETWLDQGLYDQVISHCRYILNRYPKAIEPYQLLGKAYLENKQYSEAIDLFQRVLSSRPDDFVSHIGMSIIREDEGNLNEAIWHMERAYEIQPSNKAIQGELRRLIGKRDGIEPAKINLNRSALARMYLKGNLQSQAIAEIRMALTEDPKRPDLQVLLAKAYYDLHQEKEAADVSSQLLSTLPYCFDANLILYHIAVSNNKAKEAQLYLNRLSELDPYAAFLSDGTPTPDLVMDDAVMIETMSIPASQEESIPSIQPDWEFGEETTSEKQVPPQADWINNLSEENVSEQSIEAKSQTPELPDWLREAGWEEATSESETEAEQEIVPPFSEGELDIEPGEIPDWLKELSPVDATEGEDNVTPIAEQEIESILAESTLTSTTPESVDWLSELEITPKPANQEIEPAPTFEETAHEEVEPLGVFSEESPKEETPVPNWLVETPIGEKELSLESEPPISELDTKPVLIQFESTNIPLELSPEDSPDWVKEYLESQIESETSESMDSSAAVGEKEKLSTEESAIPEWLMETLEEQPQSEVETQAEENLELPDELFIESRPEVTPTLNVVPEETIPDWVKNASGVFIEEEEVTEFDAELTKEELPDWIKEVLPQDTLAETPTQSEDITEAELPDWIKSEYDESINEPAPLQEMAEEKLPDWIRVDFTQTEEEKSITSESAVPTEELPIWIKEEFIEEPSLEKSQAGIEPVSEELPLWEGEQPTPTIAEHIEPSVEETEKQSIVEPAGTWQKEFEQPLDTTNILNNARLALHGGELETALSAYASLIKQRQELDAIINDLSNAVYQYPMEIKMWIILGDAYMRKDLLAEALNAYNKAEELIR